MTTLTDEVAEAIKAEQLANLSACHNPGQIDETKLSRAAIAVFARWLREPSEETARVALEAYRFGTPEILRALASHLEKEMG